jgi:hypothetical protein
MSVLELSRKKQIKRQELIAAIICSKYRISHLQGTEKTETTATIDLEKFRRNYPLFLEKILQHLRSYSEVKYDLRVMSAKSLTRPVN